MLNPKEFAPLRAAFNEIDTDLSGTIEANELKEAVKKSDVEIKDEDLD